MVAGRDALRRPSAGSTSSSSGASSYFDRYPERKGQGEYVPDQKLAMPRFKTLYRDGTSVLSVAGASTSSASTPAPLVSPLKTTTSTRSTKDADAASRALAAASRPPLYASRSSTSPVSPTGSYSRYAPPPDAMSLSTSPASQRTSLSADEPMRSRGAGLTPSVSRSSDKYRALTPSPVDNKKRSSGEGSGSLAGRASSSSVSLVSSIASSLGARQAGNQTPGPSHSMLTSGSTSSLASSSYHDTLHDSMMTGSKSRTRERLEKAFAERMGEGRGTTSQRAEATASSSHRPVAGGSVTTTSTSQRSIPSFTSSSSIAFVSSSSSGASFESFAPSLRSDGGGRKADRPTSVSSLSNDSQAAPQPPSSAGRIATIDEIIARNAGVTRPPLPSLQSAPQISRARTHLAASSSSTTVANSRDSGVSSGALYKNGSLDAYQAPTSRFASGRRPSATPSFTSSASASADLPPPLPPKDAVPSIDDIINSFRGSLTPARPPSVASKTPTRSLAPSTPRLVLPESGSTRSVDEWGKGPASVSSRRPSISDAGWGSSHVRKTSTGSESDAASMTSMDSVEREVYSSLRTARISESAPPDERDDDDDDDTSYFAPSSAFSEGPTPRREASYTRSADVVASPKSSSSPRSPGSSNKLQSFVALPRKRQSNSSLFSTWSNQPSSSAMSRGHSSPGGPSSEKKKIVHYSSRHAPRTRTLSGASSTRDGSVASTLRLDTAVTSSSSSLRKPSTPLSSSSGFGSSHRISMGPGFPSLVSPTANAQDAALSRYLRSPRLTQLITLLRPPYAGSVVSLADVGDPNGHPVVVFLGLGAVRYLIGLYDDMAKAMGLRLICIDRWGMGKTSDMPSARRGIRPWAFVVVEVLDRLGVRRCSLLAHSAGAPYAMALALALREAAEHQADPPPIEVAGPILLLAPWVSSTIDNGYKWLRYVPDSVIKTAQAAEWKMQGWKLGKNGAAQAQAQAQVSNGLGASTARAENGGTNAASPPATPLHSYDAAQASPPGSISSSVVPSGGEAQDAASTKPSRARPNLLGTFFGATNGAPSSSGSSRLSPGSGPSTPSLGPYYGGPTGSSSPHLPQRPRRAFSSNGDADSASVHSRSSAKLRRSSSSVAVGSHYPVAWHAAGGEDGAADSTDSDLSRGEDQLGELRDGLAPSAASMVLGGSGGERRSARIASWIPSESALAMLDGRLDAAHILAGGDKASAASASATPVLGGGGQDVTFARLEPTTSTSGYGGSNNDASPDLATALLRASHSESLKGASADLLTILGRSSQQPWGFTYTDVCHAGGTLVWHGDKDEKIGLNGALWMERCLEGCELRIVQGAGHGLMTNVDVVIEALEMAAERARD